MLYLIIKIIVLILCLIGLAYMTKMKNQYKNDKSSTKEDIIKYFKSKNAINLENGIKTKDLPKEITKNPYLTMMVMDKTLLFKKGKYYLNNKMN